ncbi:RidA family protein [Bryobacter aggregatus]|uniref:RidA family protein n=1 Tax=Bryobacter aggregatus TaxID=360054 RepID=UPI0004E27F80|nr:RidA family protein [Bryobacter aggregatus]
MRTVISTDKAPKAIGPYSQAIVHNGVAYLSGQIPLDPSSGQIVEGGIEEQTVRVLENLGAVLQASGASFGTVLKVGIFVRDMNDFAKVNEIYARYFPIDAPARATIQAAKLPRDVMVEIDCIAALV